MLQERSDARDGQVFDGELGGVAIFAGKELQQEFDTVTVTAERMRAEGSLPGQVRAGRNTYPTGSPRFRDGLFPLEASHPARSAARASTQRSTC